MTRLLLVLMALAVLLTIAPAAPVPRRPKSDEPPYHPTVVGTKLVYDRSGTEETWVVTKVELKGDARLVTTELEREDGTRWPFQKMLVSPKGLVLVAKAGENYDPPWCVLRLPHTPGAKWDIACSRAKRFQVTGSETAEVAEVVSVPAGRYKALKVAWDDGTGERGSGPATFWYAPHVGLVRIFCGSN